MADRSLLLDAFLPYRLSFTSSLVSETVAGAYQALFGISIPEWRVVAWVAETGGITQQAIGTRSRMDKVTVSRAAIALVGRGLLERRPNPDDKRSHLLALTDAGQQLHAAIAPAALDLEERLFAIFTDEERAVFEGMLRRIDAATLDLATGIKPPSAP